VSPIRSLLRRLSVSRLVSLSSVFVCLSRAQILGEGYTTPVYYTMNCGGATVTNGGETSTLWNETVTVQFYSDAACATAMAPQTIYEQSSCLDVHGSYYQSQRWECAAGKAQCMLCPNNAAAAPHAAAAATALLAAAVTAAASLLALVVL